MAVQTHTKKGDCQRVELGEGDIEQIENLVSTTFSYCHKIMSDMTLWIESGDWRSYEAYVAGWLSAAHPGVMFKANVKLQGRKSGIPRQFDILAQAQHRVAIECKYYSRKVDVKCVESFLGMLDDVGIRRGIIVTAKGYTVAALARAENDPRQIDLAIISPERLSNYQFLGAPLIWRGTLGIWFDTIPGWVTDTELTDKPNGALMIMYPLGHSLASAMHRAPAIYANILSKPATGSSLETIAAPHQVNLVKHDPNYCFTFQRCSLADRDSTTRQALLRKASGPRPIYGEEHALYIDYGDAVLLLVLNVPPKEGDTLQPLLLKLYNESLGSKLRTRPSQPIPAGRSDLITPDRDEFILRFYLIAGETAILFAIDPQSRPDGPDSRRRQISAGRLDAEG